MPDPADQSIDLTRLAAHTPRRMRGSLRHGLPFAAIFGLVGVSMAFWPAYLADRGISPSYIGLLLSAAPWLRLVINGPVGRAADERLGLRRTFGLFALTLLVGTSLLLIPETGHRLLVAGTLIMAVGFSPLASLADASAMVHAEGRYARARSWGSVAFIVTSLGLGTLLEGRSTAFVPYALALAAGSITLASICIPRRALTSSRQDSRRGRAAPTAAPTSRRRAPTPPRATPQPLPPLLGICVVAGLLQGSHAVLYGFGTLHWRASGVDELEVGVLWSVGVVAEIVVFMLADRRLAHLHPRTLLWIAAGGGVLRWTLTAFVTAVPALVAVQLLHGATFACAHLGVLRTVARIVPPARMATAVARVAAVGGGLAMGVGALVSGVAYEHLGGLAFLVAAGTSAAALLGILIFRVRSPGSAAQQTP